MNETRYCTVSGILYALAHYPPPKQRSTVLYGSKATLQRSARAAIARSPRALLSHRCRALSSLASLNRHLIPLSLRRMAACALLAAPVGPASVSPCLHSPLYMGAHLPAGFARKALTARSNSRQYWSRPTCTETPRAM